MHQLAQQHVLDRYNINCTANPEIEQTIFHSVMCTEGRRHFHENECSFTIHISIFSRLEHQNDEQV